MSKNDMRVSIKPGSVTQKSETVNLQSPAPKETLATAVVAACCLRDLARIKRLYPGCLDQEEERRLCNEASVWLDSALSHDSLAHFRAEVENSSTEKDIEGTMAVLFGVLLLLHPNITVTAIEECNSVEFQKTIDDLVARAPLSLREIAKRVQQIQIMDCLTPCPENEGEYRDPRRSLHLLFKYWAVIRCLLINHTRQPMGYRPHPLLRIIINLQKRMEACLANLTECNGICDIAAKITYLFDAELNSGPDDFDVGEDYIFERIQEVDFFLESTRIKMKPLNFELTYEERLAIQMFEDAVHSHSKRIESEFQKILDRASEVAERAKRVQDLRCYLSEEKGPFFYCAASQENANRLCRLFSKTYGPQSSFVTKKACDLDEDDCFLIDEQLDLLHLIVDPDPGLYDFPINQRQVELYWQAHRWESRLLENKTAESVSKEPPQRSKPEPTMPSPASEKCIPNPSAPFSLEYIAEAWGGDMTKKKLRPMIGKSVKGRQLNRQTWIISLDDVPEAARKKLASTPPNSA